MTRQEVEDRVAEYIELAEQGESVDPSTYASRFPRIERELLRALAALTEADGLLPSGSDALPANIGVYRVVGEIGSGGMGRVLRVRSPRHPERDLALKLLHPFAALDPRSTERFRREGEVLKALSHENIVRVHEVGMFGTTPFIVMDRVEGQSLAQLIRAARTTLGKKARRITLDLPGSGSRPQRVARVVAQLARAVAAVHAAGALHRDIKPSNVILRADGTPVLVDFGLVHWASAATLTKTGDLLGTPQYMPPEQARGQATDERSDVYGLGAVLYELLSLQPPHEGDEALAVLETVRSRPVPPVETRAHDIPRDLARVVRSALAFRPRYRTPDAAALADDLEAFLSGRPVKARSPGLVERIDAAFMFHRPAVVAVLIAPILVVGLTLFLRHRAEENRLAAQASFDGALRAWVERDTETARALARQALTQDSDHRWAGLLSAIVEERELDPSQDPAVEALRTGWLHHRERKHAEAMDDFARAAALAGGEPLPIVALAFEAQLADDILRAQRELTAAVNLLPRSPRLLEELGTVLYARQEFGDAKQHFGAALELTPDNPVLLTLFARAQFRLGQFKSGLVAAERAYEIVGDKASTRVLITYGALLDANGRRTEARTMFARAEERSPKSATPPISIAISLDKEHRAREAADAYWHAAEVGPPAKALMSLAYLYAGAQSKTCEECRVVYRDNPDLLDFERAEACALGALEADDGNEPGLPLVGADVALMIDRRDKIRSAIEGLRDRSTDDERIARYERALRMLRPPKN